MENHHLQKSVGSGQELPHDNLEEMLALKILLLTVQLDLKLLKQIRNLVCLEVHDGVEDAEDRVQDELVESTLEWLALMIANLGPLLGLGVEEAVALYIVSIISGYQVSVSNELTQRRSIILFLSTPNFLAYRLAN